MNRFSRPLAAAAFAATLVMGATPAWAASHKGGGSGGGGGGTTAGTGIDVSTPQCPGTSLPSGETFAIVSVTGGLANDYNSCLNNEFAYAQQLTGTPHQAKAQLYVNTADPGNSVADWPSPAQPGSFGGGATPYGVCGYANGTGSGPGANSAACAYQYGYDMVAGINYSSGNGGDIIGDLADFNNVTKDYMYHYPVWLDVETTNSWQSSSSPDGQAMNTADLQGMVDAFKAATPAGATSTVGVYSTGYQWGQITGNPTAAGNLAGLPEWLPGATGQSGAVSNCSVTSFTGGRVTITQWTSRYDYDYSCIG